MAQEWTRLKSNRSMTSKTARAGLHELARTNQTATAAQKRFLNTLSAKCRELNLKSTRPADIFIECGCNYRKAYSIAIIRTTRLLNDNGVMELNGHPLVPFYYREQDDFRSKEKRQMIAAWKHNPYSNN